MKCTLHILSLLLAMGSIVSCRLTPPATASAQIATWPSADSGRSQFMLSEIQDVPPWTALYFFAPYTPTSAIEQRLGFEWPDAKRFSLDSREDIHLAVFVSG